jgi:hypothetical protein
MMIETAGDFDVILPANPYPGLRPFEKHEWAIFFGRERMIDEVIHRLITQQFLMVHGDSGCGKSSLIKAGVLARLEQENARGGATWRTAEMQPREAPLDTLARVLASLQAREPNSQRIFEIRRILNFGPDAPQAIAQLIRRADTDRVCLLVDQFEELFAFARRGGRDEATLFVQFLVSLVEKPPTGLYCVTTMRSEFLGVCAQFPGLAESVNKVQYLLPRMAHLDLVRAIREPGPANDGQVSKDLALHLINDAGGTQDELPLIQHGLMALYRRKVRADGRPVEANWRLDLADYEGEARSLAELLSRHADDVADRVEATDGRVVQTLFGALTEINAEGQAIRRPQPFGLLLRVTGADELTLRHVVQAFRAEGNSFLRPYGDEPIERDTIVDISHEALIRSWQRIADPKDGWLAREFQDGLVWKSLLVQAESFERDPSNVLSPATAKERERWLTVHNSAWAERYGSGWDRVAHLVDGSVEAAQKAEKAERATARNQLGLAIATTVILAAFLIYAVIENGKTAAALAQAYAASATSLSNRLDFSTPRAADDELNALWEIAAGSPPVREAFVDLLAIEAEHLQRFGRRPAPIVRAIGLRWPAEKANAAFAFAVSSISDRTSASQLARLGAAALGLGAALTPDEARAALPMLTAALKTSNDANRSLALTQGVSGLAPLLPPQDAGEALPFVVAAMSESATSSSGPTALPSRLDTVAATLARRLTPEQAGGALIRALDASMGTAGGPPIAVLMVRTLAEKLGPEQAQAALLTVFDHLARAQDAHDVRMLNGAAEALEALADRLSDSQVHAVFPAWFTGLKAAKEAEWIEAWSIASLISRIGSEEALAVFNHVVDTVGNPAADEATFELVEIGREVSGRLAPEQARSALERARLAHNTPGTMIAALHASLAVKGSQADAAPALRGILSAISATVEPQELRQLGVAAQAIARKLPPAQAHLALRSVLFQVTRADDEDQLAALCEIAERLVERLTPAQANTIFPALVAAINHPEFSGVPALASAAQALGSLQTPAQAQAAFSAALKSLGGGRNAQSIIGAAHTVQIVADSLSADHAEAAFDVIGRQILQITDPDVLESLGDAAEVVGRKIASPRADHVFARMFARVPELTDTDQIAAFSAAAAGLGGRLSPQTGRRAATKLVELLRDRRNPRRTPWFALFAGALANYFAPDEAAAVFQQLVTFIASTSGSERLGRLGGAADAVARTLSAEQARASMAVLTSNLTARSDPTSPVRRAAETDQLGALYRAAIGVASRLAPADA